MESEAGIRMSPDLLRNPQEKAQTGDHDVCVEYDESKTPESFLAENWITKPIQGSTLDMPI